MSEIEKKALALINEVERDFGDNSPTIRIIREDYMDEALCRAIEKHEADKAAHAATIEGILKAHQAYKQEVSDAVVEYFGPKHLDIILAGYLLEHFIIPKPDPLVEAVGEAMQEHEVYSEYELTESLHNALAKRGLKIVETGQ